MSTAYGTSVPSLFRPSQISGCQLWLDSSDSSSLTTSGTSVTQWNDKSGNGNNATATGTITTTGSINRKVSLNWSGAVSTYFRGALVNSGTTLTAFSVFNMDSASYTTARILSLGKAGFVDYNTTLYTAAIERQSGSIFNAFRNSANLSEVPATFGSPVLVCSQFDGTNHTLYLNGTGGTPVASSGSFGITIYEIGNSINEENLIQFTGQIGEVIYFSGSLTTIQRQQIEGYLAWKWGLQGDLPSTHPYKNTPLYQQPPFPLVPRVLYTTMFPTLNPLSIGGISIWLDAYDVNANGTTPTNGSSITSWKDKSGNGLNATQYGSSNVPTYSATGFNSKPTVSFSSSLLQIPNINPNTVLTSNGTDSSIYAVVKISGDGSQYGSIFGLATTNDHYVLRTPWANSYKIWDCGDRVDYFATTNGNYIFSLVRSGPSMGMFMNGTNVASNSSAATTITTTPQGLNLGIGIFSAGGLFPGTLSEFIIYKGGANLYQRQAIEGFLANKWGLQGSLPSTHPYKSMIPFTPGPFPVVPSEKRVMNRSFSPTNIPGCQLWLDGADPNGNGSLPVNGTSISSWTDKSGVGNNGTQGTSANQPSFSNKGLVFSGSQWLTTSITSVPSTESFFIVFTTTGNTGVDLFAGTASGYREVLLYNGTFYTGKFGTVPSGTNGGTISTNTLLQMNYQYTTSALTFSVNGSVTGSGTPPYTYTGTNTSYIGSSTYSPNNFNGTIYEIIYYNTSLLASQRQAIEGYLAWKWGLKANLPATHPYKLFPPPP